MNKLRWPSTTRSHPHRRVNLSHNCCQDSILHHNRQSATRIPTELAYKDSITLNYRVNNAIILNNAPIYLCEWSISGEMHAFEYNWDRCFVCIIIRQETENHIHHNCSVTMAFFLHESSVFAYMHHVVWSSSWATTIISLTTIDYFNVNNDLSAQLICVLSSGKTLILVSLLSLN